MRNDVNSIVDLVNVDVVTLLDEVDCDRVDHEVGTCSHAAVADRIVGRRVGRAPSDTDPRKLALRPRLEKKIKNRGEEKKRESERERERARTGERYRDAQRDHERDNEVETEISVCV